MLLVSRANNPVCFKTHMYPQYVYIMPTLDLNPEVKLDHQTLKPRPKPLYQKPPNPHLQDLVQLQADEPGGHGGGRGDGGDDAPGDELGLELVHLRDLVVARAHVGEARDEVHVEVGVVILYSIRRGLQPCTRAVTHQTGCRSRGSKERKLVSVVASCFGANSDEVPVGGWCRHSVHRNENRAPALAAWQPSRKNTTARCMGVDGG